MSNDVKAGQTSERSNKKNEKAQEQKTGYVNWWLFRDKGTVAEDWPTAEQMWNNNDVQSEIKKVQKAFRHGKSEEKDD